VHQVIDDDFHVGEPANERVEHVEPLAAQLGDDGILSSSQVSHALKVFGSSSESACLSIVLPALKMRRPVTRLPCQ